MTPHYLTTGKYFITALCVGLSLFAYTALAQVVVSDGPLTVTFESLPLFNAPDQTNIAPGYVNEKHIIVTNTGSVAESVLFVTSNSFSTGLASQMQINVRDKLTGDVYFDATAETLFLETSIGLGVLGAGASRTYAIGTAFSTTSGNSYQGTTMGFDVAFGFTTGATVVPPDGGGGGGTRLPTPGTPNLPPGQVAGATDSLLPWAPVWVNEAFEWLQGVSNSVPLTSGDEGEEITGGEGDSDQGEVNGLEQVAGEATVTPANEIVAAIANDMCLATWLLALTIISILVAAIDDRWRRNEAHFLTFWRRHMLFTLGYSLAVLLITWLGAISIFGIPLAIIWVVMQIVDYRAHIGYFETWTPAVRLLVYIVSAAAFGLSSLIWAWPCVWWPFAVIAVGAIVTFIFDR